MAVIYLRSTDGSDASDGLTWANAKATLASAFVAAGAGGTVYVSKSHAESNATNHNVGTIGSPIRVVSVDDTGDPEPPTASLAGAVFTRTGGTIEGFIRFHKCTFVLSAQSFWGDPNSGLLFESCAFDQRTNNFFVGTNAAGGAHHVVEFRNTTFVFDAVTRSISCAGISARFVGCTYAASGTVPTTLFTHWGSNGRFDVYACDLSAFTTGKNILSRTNHNGSVWRFLSCKLGAGVSFATGTWTAGAAGVTGAVFINCDSDDSNYRYARDTYLATEVHDIVIVRTGGASNGTTAIARRIDTSADVTPSFPYESLPIELWNESIGSPITATVAIVTDNITLTDAEAWLEVEYLGTNGVPLGSLISDRVSDSIFGTPANQTSDTGSTWTTTGLTTPVKQQLSVTFTPQEKGVIRARVVLAKPSTTMYYDPKVVLS